MTAEKIALGTGIYTVSDIATILKINKDTARRWLKNYFSDNQVKLDKNLFVNFYSLIEIYVFNKLLENQIKRSYIKQLYKFLKSKGYEYPLAQKNFYILGNQLFVKYKNIVIDGHLSGIIQDMVKPFWQKIDFDSQGLARRFYPYGKNSYIVVDPEIQFGQPIIKNTRITAETLFEMHKYGDSPQDLALYFDIPIEAVKEALNLFSL